MTFAPRLSGMSNRGRPTATLVFHYTVQPADRGGTLTLDELVLRPPNELLRDGRGTQLLTALPSHSTDGISFGRARRGR